MKKGAKMKITCIGGGTGTCTVLSALKKYLAHLSAIVSMCDSGGSAGRLRDQYGVLPHGDVRRCLIALSEADFEFREMFEYRFERGELGGHSLGNLILTYLEKRHGDDYAKVASRLLRVKGNVYPVTFNRKLVLCAKLADGAVVKGETYIDIPKKRNPEIPIVKIYTEPKAKANPDAIRAIHEADAIIVGPGDLYTSVLPNFLIEGIVPALELSKAKKIYVCNLMTKYGETNGYTVKDFIDAVHKYTGSMTLDCVLVNSGIPNPARLKGYKKEEAELVKVPKNLGEYKIMRADLITDKGLVRHDYEKLGRAIMKLVAN